MKLASLVLAYLAFAITTAAFAQTGQTGYAIYHQGTAMDGDAIVGRTAGIELAGPHAACANCHRSPRDGGSEGGVNAPALAWEELADRAYDRASFAKALEDGISPEGRSLHALMPRFRFSAAELDSLLAYLRQEHTVPGVSDEAVTIATILPAAPHLRAYGEASAAAVARAVREGSERYYGRRLRHVELDASLPSRQLERLLDEDPPALVIASVGLDMRSPISDILQRRGIVNFAPVAALSGTPDEGMVLPLLPGLREQAIALVEESQAHYGCVDLAIGADAISLAAAQSVVMLVETSPHCPGLLVLAQPGEIGGVLNRLQSRRIRQLYASAEQVGPILARLANRCALTVAVSSPHDFATTVERNASQSVQVLQTALALSGRQFSRETLLENLRATTPPVSAVIRRFNAPPEGSNDCRLDNARF